MGLGEINETKHWINRHSANKQILKQIRKCLKKHHVMSLLSVATNIAATGEAEPYRAESKAAEPAADGRTWMWVWTRIVTPSATCCLPTNTHTSAATHTATWEREKETIGLNCKYWGDQYLFQNILWIKTVVFVGISWTVCRDNRSVVAF